MEFSINIEGFDCVSKKKEIKEPRKRGRPFGSKNKPRVYRFVEKDDEARKILDYMMENFPEYNIHEIKNKVLHNFDEIKNYEESDYILDKVEHNGVPYYYDEVGRVYNQNVELVGIWKNNKIHFN